MPQFWANGCGYTLCTWHCDKCGGWGTGGGGWLVHNDDMDICGPVEYVQIGSWRSGRLTGTWFMSTISVGDAWCCCCCGGCWWCTVGVCWNRLGMVSHERCGNRARRIIEMFCCWICCWFCILRGDWRCSHTDGGDWLGMREDTRRRLRDGLSDLMPLSVIYGGLDDCRLPLLLLCEWCELPGLLLLLLLLILILLLLLMLLWYCGLMRSRWPFMRESMDERGS